MGRRDEALDMIREYARLGATPVNLGLMYLGLGENGKALDYWEKAAGPERADVTHAIPQYHARVLDSDRRFQALKVKLGMVE